MNSYKNYEKVFIGASDKAFLTMSGKDENGKEFSKHLNFGQDGVYKAYIVDDAAEIGKHYEETAVFYDFLKITDDAEETKVFSGKQIKVFQAGEYGCIIQIFN